MHFLRPDDSSQAGWISRPTPLPGTHMYPGAIGTASPSGRSWPPVHVLNPRPSSIQVRCPSTQVPLASVGLGTGAASLVSVVVGWGGVGTSSVVETGVVLGVTGEAGMVGTGSGGAWEVVDPVFPEPGWPGTALPARGFPSQGCWKRFSVPSGCSTEEPGFGYAIESCCLTASSVVHSPVRSPRLAKNSSGKSVRLLILPPCSRRRRSAPVSSCHHHLPRHTLQRW